MTRWAHGMFHGSMIPTRLRRVWKARCVPLPVTVVVGLGGLNQGLDLAGVRCCDHDA
jgi:hypothetical protein